MQHTRNIVFVLCVLLTSIVMFSDNIHHPTSFILGMSAAEKAAKMGPFVYFLPTDQICGSHSMNSPSVQIVHAPTDMGRIIGLPSPTPAYLTSASMDSLLLCGIMNKPQWKSFF